MEEVFEIVCKIKEIYTCDIKVSEEEPYALFNVIDIGIIIENYNIIEIVELWDHDKLVDGYFTYIGLLLILSKSKKISAAKFAKDVGIQLKRTDFIFTENNVTECILSFFKDSEEIIEYHKIGNYIVDIYFPRIKLIVQAYDGSLEKENNINKLLNYNCNFINYNPSTSIFCIFQLINRINKYVNNKVTYSSKLSSKIIDFELDDFS